MDTIPVIWYKWRWTTFKMYSKYEWVVGGRSSSSWYEEAVWQGLQVSSERCSWDTVWRFWSLCLFVCFGRSENEAILSCLHLTNSSTVIVVVDNPVLFYFSCGRWAAAVLTQRQGSSCGLLLVDFEKDLMCVYALTGYGKMKLVRKTSWILTGRNLFDCFGRSEEALNTKVELVGNWGWLIRLAEMLFVVAIACSSWGMTTAMPVS